VHSFRLKLLAAFVAVALVSAAVVGVLVSRAAAGAFDAYLLGRGGGDQMLRAMDEMMGLQASRAMVQRMIGPAESAFLASVQTSVWLAAGIGVLLAIAIGLILARQIAAPVRALSAATRRLAAGERGRTITLRSQDEFGELSAAFSGLTEALSLQESLRRQMAADIAHELRTPVAVLQANLEALIDGVLPLSVSALTELHQETQILARLIADLRDLSLAEAGKLPLEQEQASLLELVEASRDRFTAEARAKGVQLDVMAGHDTEKSAQVNVDSQRMLQVLGNLLENALRHTPVGGHVQLRVARGARPDTAEVSVHDTGPGIAAEHLANLFERFYRVDVARSRDSGGSGIGLALVKQLVLAQGGTVSVESSPAAGTTFRVVLATVCSSVAAEEVRRLETRENPCGRFESFMECNGPTRPPEQS